MLMARILQYKSTNQLHINEIVKISTPTRNQTYFPCMLDDTKCVNAAYSFHLHCSGKIISDAAILHGVVDLHGYRSKREWRSVITQMHQSNPSGATATLFAVQLSCATFLELCCTQTAPSSPQRAGQSDCRAAKERWAQNGVAIMAERRRDSDKRSLHTRAEKTLNHTLTHETRGRENSRGLVWLHSHQFCDTIFASWFPSVV